MRRYRLALPLGLLVPVAAASAGGGPEGVLVVVNEDSWASMTVASEFIAPRNISVGNVGNVVYLTEAQRGGQLRDDRRGGPPTSLK